MSVQLVERTVRLPTKARPSGTKDVDPFQGKGAFMVEWDASQKRVRAAATGTAANWFAGGVGIGVGAVAAGGVIWWLTKRKK